MILSLNEILGSVAEGSIGFDPPIEKAQYGEASIDLRLGYIFTEIKSQPGISISVADGLDPFLSTRLWKQADLSEPDEFGRPRSYELLPNQFVLGMTYETIMVPRDMIARIEGRSTYARVGLSMHQTAPWIQPGWRGKITLEIMNNGPLTIKLTPLKDRPCQLTFFKLTSKIPEESSYGAKEQDSFQGQKSPLGPERPAHPPIGGD